MLHFIIFVNKGRNEGIEPFRMNSEVDYSFFFEEIVNAYNGVDITT